MTADLLAAPLAWGGIGWLLDRWLGTSPWVMVAGLGLGFVLGFYLLYRRATAAMMREEERRARL